MEIRDYRAEDGAACHELRHTAFLEVFSRILSPDAIRAGTESYTISEFSALISTMETRVASIGDIVAGFCSIRVQSRTRAELLYLYVGPDHRGTGVGSRLAHDAERRISNSHPDLETIFLETAVPEYNQSFWERLGYRLVGPSSCDYPTGKIPAVRLEKRLHEPGAGEVLPD